MFEALLVLGLAGLAFIAFFLFSKMNRKKTPLSLRVAGDRNAMASKQATVRTSDFIIVSFTSVELKREGEERAEAFDFDEHKEIDLLSMPVGLPDKLLSTPVLSGRYEWIRLMLDSEKCRIRSGGVETKLHIPSSGVSGLKLVSGFTVPENGNADFTILFDVQKSLTKKPSGEFVMRPTLRLIDNNRQVPEPTESPIADEGDSE
jgi:hypothetical protein